MASLILPIFSLARETEDVKVVVTHEKPIGERLDDLLQGLKQGLIGAWQEALGIWKKMLDGVKNLWEQKIWSFFFRKIEEGIQKIGNVILEKFRALLNR